MSAATLHGFSREDLEAIAEGLDTYERTVNVGNVTGEGDCHLESTTAAAARFIRSALAAPSQPVAPLPPAALAAARAFGAGLDSQSLEQPSEVV